MAESAQQYIQRILGHVEGQDALKVQRATAGRLKKLIHGLTPRQLKWQPEPGKWSIVEILAHLADAEIVASWRKRDPKQSLEVFRVLRENNLAMLKALPPDAWERHGMHLERGKETIAHLTRMFAGHDTNHLAQIEKIVAQVKKRKQK
jgi:hypothetical protein